MDAKVATISIFPKIILLSLIKIAIRHPKISGLKISVDSLKISGLKIIARMWVRMCARVCACAPNFAEVSKIVQDATRAGTHDNRKSEERQ